MHSGFALLLFILCVINISSHYLQNIIGFWKYHYFSYICWLMLLAGEIAFLRPKLLKRQIIFLWVLGTSFCVGAFVGEQYFGTGLSELHRAAFVCIQFFLLFCLRSHVTLKKEDIWMLCRLLFVLGLISSFYAMIMQREYVLGALNGDSGSAWRYMSFFGQRNKYAVFCFIASIAGCYLFFSKKNVIYAIGVAFLGVQILITTSRAALLGYVVLVAFSVYFSSKNKKALIIIAMVGAVIAVIIGFEFGLIEWLLEKMRHTTASGHDSGFDRLAMWKLCIDFILQKSSLISGFGMGSTVFLIPIYGLESYHNAYVDALFCGGIIYLTAMIYAMYCGYKWTLKNGDSAFKNVFLAAWVAFPIYCLFESGASILASNFFTVSVTVLLLIVPRYYTGKDD